MIFVLYTFGGWNDAAFVAAEVRDPKRNIPRVLLLGTLAITAIYLLANLAYLLGLGFEGVRASSAPAADLAERVIGSAGARGISLLVIISALGAVNGLIFTGARIFTAMGRDHALFAQLGSWSQTRNAPVWSIVAQGVVTLVLILMVGTEVGRNSLNAALAACRVPTIPWSDYGGGFDCLVAGTAPVFWTFFLLTSLSLFILRHFGRDVEVVYAVPLYPLVPIVFSLMCGYMLYSSVPLLLGIPAYGLSRVRRRCD